MAVYSLFFTRQDINKKHKFALKVSQNSLCGLIEKLK